MYNPMESSEYYNGVKMTKEEYLSLPPMDEFLKIHGDYVDKKITKEQALGKVSDVYRVLGGELVESILNLGEEHKPLFPIKRIVGKNLSPYPEMVKLI